MECRLVGHTPGSKWNAETQKATPIILGKVELYPVSGETPENKLFFDSTPSGKLEFASVNKAAIDQFTPGKSYYVDITEAPE